MKKLIYITFILFVTISCSNKHTTNNKVEIADFSNLDFKKEVELSKDFNYKVIPLETNDSCLIGDIDRVVCLNNSLYILDQTTTTLFVFNLKGKFLFKLAPIGGSYKECSYVNDFNIYKDNIILLGANSRKLLFFDLMGKYIKTLKLEDYGNRNIKFLSDSLFVTTLSYNGEEIIDYWNLKGNKIKSFKKGSSVKYTTGLIRPLTTNISNNNTYVNFNFNDTIFKISKENYSSSIFIDFGSKCFPKEKFKDAKKFSKEFNSNTKYNSLFDYSITNNYIYADIKEGHHIYTAIYNRKTHKRITGKMVKFNGYFIGTITGDLKNGFISYMEPTQINYINKKKNGKMFKNVKKSDNPLIVLVTEKDKTLNTDNTKKE